MATTTSTMAKLIVWNENEEEEEEKNNQSKRGLHSVEIIQNFLSSF